jgi:hypothetical protein
VFLASTLVTEVAGSPEAVARLKTLFVVPGLLVLVPAIAAAGGTGFVLSRSRPGGLAARKKRRMPVIAGNGLLVLVPAAILLDRWASAGSFDARFYVVQAIELVAGGLNLTLMGLNVRDGLALSGRLHRGRPGSPASRPTGWA